MRRLIYDMYYADEITQDIAIKLLDKLTQIRDKKRYQMIEFIKGLLVVIPLIPINDILIIWAKKDPMKTLGIVSIMFGMNLVIILTYGFLLKTGEPTSFILGLLSAILIVMIRKIKTLIK